MVEEKENKEPSVNNLVMFDKTMNELEKRLYPLCRILFLLAACFGLFRLAVYLLFLK